MELVAALRAGDAQKDGGEPAAANVPVPDDDDHEADVSMAWTVRLLDLKGVARPPPFSGKQEDWAEWRFKFLSAMDLLAIGRYMRLAESVERPVTVAEMRLDAAEVGAPSCHLRCCVQRQGVHPAQTCEGQQRP